MSQEQSTIESLKFQLWREAKTREDLQELFRLLDSGEGIRLLRRAIGTVNKKDFEQAAKVVWSASILWRECDDAKARDYLRKVSRRWLSLAERAMDPMAREWLHNAINRKRKTRKAANPSGHEAFGVGNQNTEEVPVP